MNHQEHNQKRKTIQIRLQPKPAAPRHPMVVARAIPMPNPTAPAEAKRRLFLFPIVQVAIASILAMMVLDMGECYHIVTFAALGYAGGLLLMAPRREELTLTDEFLIRWGFVILCFVSALVAAIIWPLRGLIL